MRAAGVSLAALIIVLASIIGLTGAISPVSTANVTGCVIRFAPSGPRIHVDRTHDCPNVTEVEVDAGGRLVVHRHNGETVQAAMVSPDETLSARGIIAGASWARTRTTIQFYNTETGVIRADDPDLQGRTANVWITWVTSP